MRKLRSETKDHCTCKGGMEKRQRTMIILQDREKNEERRRRMERLIREVQRMKDEKKKTIRCEEEDIDGERQEDYHP
jgi:hypothetical protein